MVATLFIFDDPHDHFSPYRAFGFSYLGAAICQFLAGSAILRTNEQIRTYFASQAVARILTLTWNIWGWRKPMGQA